VRTAALRGELAKMAFHEAVFGRRRLYLAEAIATHAELINRTLTSTRFGGGEPAAGNRRSAVALNIAGLPPMFARRYRRGGLMRFLVSELYAGLVPRPLHELMVTAAARQRGLPVVEPMGAMVETAGPCLYRGWFLTRALDGATLWTVLLSGGEQHLRREALAQARAGVDCLHEGGLYHADLNFHNLFVCMGERPARIVALDLDKARLYPAALPPALRRANFSRLARSARRLAEAGAVLTAEERRTLGLA
jgi:Lipopolysaccharide kinase (Kdo/WaaP) family